MEVVKITVDIEKEVSNKINLYAKERRLKKKDAINELLKLGYIKSLEIWEVKNNEN
ncbi:MAG: hypothetical protein PHX04_05695 [Bacilli bacterium]|nr:hypothetical protein [Bacilli bacterium]